MASNGGYDDTITALRDLRHCTASSTFGACGPAPIVGILGLIDRIDATLAEPVRVRFPASQFTPSLWRPVEPSEPVAWRRCWAELLGQRREVPGACGPVLN